MAPKQRVCFLICPMGDPKSEIRQRSLDLKNKILLPAMKSLDFAPPEDFLDDNGNNESIRRRMMDLIQNADLCIADLTGDNPNVFFEYGLRRATGRPVLAFVRQGQKLLYDVDDYYTEPYDLENPRGAIEAIEKFAQRTGFGRPSVQVDAERRSQTKRLCDYIADRQPKSVDILQFSLVAVRDDLFQALWRSPETVVRVLLLDPDYAAEKYGNLSRTDVLEGTELIKNLPERTLKFAPRPTPRCPTFGLWYYKHQPSVAAVMVDDKLIQLGWYFHEPDPDSGGISVKGSHQPGILARDEEARTLMEPIRNHFSSILRDAKWVLGVGAKCGDLRTEWENLAQRTSAGA
jgi:nucleoside 2-deoxyribosyltransferase